MRARHRPAALDEYQPPPELVALAWRGWQDLASDRPAPIVPPMGGRPIYQALSWSTRDAWLRRHGVGEWYGALLHETWEHMDSLFLEHHRPESADT